MRKLHIDFETRSTVDLRRANAQVYADDPATEIILCCWAVDAGPVETWITLDSPACPDSLHKLLSDPSVVICAHNAGFEMAIMSGRYLQRRHGFPDIPLDRWVDTMAQAARQAMPRALGDVGAALNLPIQKDTKGKSLMLRMCKPKGYEDGLPVYHQTPEQVERLAEYCRADVDTERLVETTLMPLPAIETSIWRLTESLNKRGLLVDLPFAVEAAKLARQRKRELDDEMKQVTGGAVGSCTQVHNLRTWCQERGFFLPDEAAEDEVASLDKNAITEQLSHDNLPEDVRRALEIRLAGAKSSVAKYDAIINRADKYDCRVRGYLVYHGAATGRWAGAGIQPQNFPRKVVADFNEAAGDVAAVNNGRLTTAELEVKHGLDTMTLLSRMLRPTIMAPAGHELIFADYAQIEARGVAWLAGAQSLTDLFANGGKVYETMAGHIYGVDPASVGADSVERFLGKTSVLGCGYGMGAAKFQTTCANQGVEISEEQALAAVQAYRGFNSEIPALWRALEDAAKRAVRKPDTTVEVQMYEHGPVTAYRLRQSDGFLMCRLPSGRHLYYYDPRIQVVQTQFGDKEALFFKTVDSFTRKWTLKATWGGHLTENVVQGLCRDLMADAMLRLADTDRYTPVLTVHDEAVCEVENATDADVERVASMMAIKPEWAAGFPVKAEAKRGRRYGK
jgi:DNA polymerase